MLILSDNQISGKVMGRSILGRTMAPAAGGALPPGVFDLLMPDSDPVFGVFVMAQRSNAPAAGTASEWKRPAAAARLNEWKSPAGGTTSFPKMQPPAGGAASFPKMQLPAGGTTSFPKMQPPAGGGASFPKMQPPAGGTTSFPKMQPPGIAADAWKLQLPGGAALQKGSPTARAVDLIKGRSPDPSAGGPRAFVLSARAIPGRYCVVVTAGFSDLLAALNATGGWQLTVV